MNLLIRLKRFIIITLLLSLSACNQLGVKEEEQTKPDLIELQKQADSLDTVELVMALEEEFETEIPDEDAEKITTVQQAIDFVTARQSAD